MPPAGTVERWAWEFILEEDPRKKLAPPPCPREWESGESGESRESIEPRRIARPGRPLGLETRGAAPKNASAAALRASETRARLFATFLHHEVQAAELMAWAVLAFPDAPLALRRGLMGVLADELRHVRMYGEHIASLGGPSWGASPVNDWFWERVPEAQTIAHFLATLGIGFEGGNLDHASRFAARLAAAGDAAGAVLQAKVGEEELPHVRFALHWFAEQTARAPIEFDHWRGYLPSPLTPTVTRGKPLDLRARRRAGFGDEFLARLDAWSPGS